MEAIVVAVITSIIAPLVLAWRIDKKEQNQHRFDELNEKLHQLAISTKKIELQTAIYNRPKEVSVIFSIFDEYKKMGGDSWADDLFLQWRQMYAKDK